MEDNTGPQAAEPGSCPNLVTDLVFTRHLNDPKKYWDALRQLMESIRVPGRFHGDNLITFSKNLSFLGDQKFVDAVNRSLSTNNKSTRQVERGIVWRTYVLCWCAQNGLRRDGDFVECGTYKGYSSHVICDYLDFDRTDRRFFLYDLFDHDPGMPHHRMPEHGSQLYDFVVERFQRFPNVIPVRGAVPETFSTHIPDRIAFLHIDMNQVEAEIAALEHLFDRLVPGGFLVLDDYGWVGYRNQKVAEDAFLAERGYQVLELPTGQGLVIK